MALSSTIIVTTFPNAAIAKQIGDKAMEARIQVAYEAALADHLAGYPLVALCEPEMRSFFRETGAILLRPEVDEPMGPGRRQIIRRAVELIGNPAQYQTNPAIVWREPEKNIARFVTDLVRPIQTGEAELVIMNRRSLESYPSWSQHWEKLGSATCSKIMGGKPQDHYSGPKAMSLLGAGYFLRYPGEQKDAPDWHDCVGCPPIDMAMDGVKITGITVDFEYPAAQREAEEDDLVTMEKRMKVQYVLFNAMLARRRWLEKRRNDKT
jgi:hypothetical protein